MVAILCYIITSGSNWFCQCVKVSNGSLIHWPLVVVPVVAISSIFQVIQIPWRSQQCYPRGGGGGAAAFQLVWLWPDHLMFIGCLSDGCLMVMQTR